MQSAHDGERDNPTQGEPDPERAQRVTPTALLGPPQGPESTQHTGYQEGERHDEDRTGQLTDGKPVMDGGGDGGQQQEEGEADGQQVAEPVHAAEEVMEALAPGEVQPMSRKRQQLPPLPAQDLDAPERPAEPLLLQAIETQWHQAFAPDGWLEDTDGTEPKHAKACLGVLGDHAFLPTADPFQRRPPDQAHRSGKDDGVAVGAGRHRDVEEIAVAVKEAAEVAAVLPIPIVLRCLHEGDSVIGEVADHLLQEARSHDVIGIDDAQDGDVRRQAASGFVERARLVAGPGIEMDELKGRSQLGAECLEGTPYLRVFGVVVDDLDQDVGVIEVGKRGQGLSHHLDRLVVAGHLDGHGRLIRGFGAMGGSGPSAEDVQDLEQVIDAERQGAGLEQEQDDRTGGAQKPQAVDKWLGARIDQVDDRGHQQGRQQLSGEEAPLRQVATGLDHGTHAEQRKNGRRHGIVHDQPCQPAGGDQDRECERDAGPAARSDQSRNHHRRGRDRGGQRKEKDELEQHLRR